MITVKLGGGIGNNMFQYASARSIAEKKGVAFCYFPVRGVEYYKKNIKKKYKYYFRGNKEKYKKQTAQKDLSCYFVLKGDGVLLRWMKRFYYFLRSNEFTEYTPPRKNYTSEFAFELYDPDALQLKKNMYASAGFQSPAYFDWNRSRVLEWFRLKKKYNKKVKGIIRSLGLPPEKLCCVHLRRGDYKHQTKGLNRKDQGWMLPLDYYHEALKHIPEDTGVIFISDEPDFVQEEFASSKPVYISTGNDDAVDMFLMTECKYNIIANSSFSWWGAWLNPLEDKQVIAPLYHLGWELEQWLPWGFEKHPEEWKYINIKEIINKVPT